MVSLLSEFRATLPFLQLRSGERDQNIINEVGAALLPRSGLVLWSKADVSIESTKLTLELVILPKRTSAKIQYSTFFKYGLFI